MVSCTAGKPTSRLRPSGPVVSALGSESDDPGSSPGRGDKALCPWDVREKNASSAFRLGLIYLLDLTVLQNVYEHVFLRIKIFPNLLAFFVSKGKSWHFHIGFLTQDLLCMQTKLNHFMHNVHLQGKPETVSRGIQINMDLVSYLRAYELHHLCCNPLTNAYWILIRATGCQRSRCSSVFPVIERETAERLTCLS